jgi:hypothetical protein
MKPDSPPLAPVLGCVLSLVLCLLTEGCVGVDIASTRTKVVQNPVLSEYPSLNGFHFRDPAHDTNIVFTSTWLKSHWGKPNSIRHGGTENRDEIWTYRYGLRWNGVGFIVLIPVPLYVPTGLQQVVFVLRDDHVICATAKRSHHQGCIVGNSLGICGITPFGVHPWNDD